MVCYFFSLCKLLIYLTYIEIEQARLGSAKRDFQIEFDVGNVGDIRSRYR